MTAPVSSHVVSEQGPNLKSFFLVLMSVLFLIHVKICLFSESSE